MHFSGIISIHDVYGIETFVVVCSLVLFLLTSLLLILNYSVVSLIILVPIIIIYVIRIAFRFGYYYRMDVILMNNNMLN